MARKSKGKDKKEEIEKKIKEETDKTKTQKVEEFKEGFKKAKKERSKSRERSEDKRVIIDNPWLHQAVEREMENIKKAVDFAHRKKVDILFSPEAGGRKEAFMFRKAYKQRYPKEKPPKVVFTNFKNVKSGEDLKEKLPKVAERLEKGDKPFILDECAHTGEEIKRAKKPIEEASEKEVLTGVMDLEPPRSSDVPGQQTRKEKRKELEEEIDFKGDKLARCPGKDLKERGKVFGTVKSDFSESTVGKKVEDKEHQKKVREARKDLSKMIEERIKPKRKEKQ